MKSLSAALVSMENYISDPHAPYPPFPEGDMNVIYHHISDDINKYAFLVSSTNARLMGTPVSSVVKTTVESDLQAAKIEFEALSAMINVVQLATQSQNTSCFNLANWTIKLAKRTQELVEANARLENTFNQLMGAV